MSQSFAVWLVILFSLLTANLPFAVQRPFLILPWAQPGEAPMPAWLRLIVSLIFFGLLIALGWLAYSLLAGAIILAGDVGSLFSFMGRVAGAFIVLAALLSFPGWRSRGLAVRKSFFDRLLEVLVFYGLAGVLGFALEANIGNPFAQTWEFYAVTLSLFLVLGYPGFVVRYLLRRRKAASRKA